MTEKELNTIHALIAKTIAEGGYMVDQELWDILLVKLPNISENHPWLTVSGLRNWLEEKLKGQYVFEGKIISHDGRTATQILQEYVKQQDSFTLTAYLSLTRALNVEGRIYPIFEHALRISQEQFVSPRLVHFDVDKTDAALSIFCTGEYLPLKDVDNLAVLPDCGQPWSIFLLAQYCERYSKGFKLIFPGYVKTGCPGAIVRKTAEISNMDELLAQALSEGRVKLEKAPALEWLIAQGYIMVKHYKNIESVLLKAGALRRGAKTKK